MNRSETKSIKKLFRKEDRMYYITRGILCLDIVGLLALLLSTIQ